MIRSLLKFSALLCWALTAAQAADSAWQPTTWNGEHALVSTTQGWKAIVSLERGRLMLFGPADAEANLLLAPPTRGNRNILGGHRLWLGPQATWPRGWPPPAAWEFSGPESFTTDGGVLRMLMPDAGDGWPRLTRTYRWDGAKLVCGAEFSGGTRSAQFVQIFQVPIQTTVSARAQPEEDFPAGYVQLPSTAGPFAAKFSPPPQVTTTGDALSLRNTGAVLKLGFRPQTLTGHVGDFILSVSRGAQHGTVASEPDRGFFTQAYLGGREPFIELEQLSPIFPAGAPAVFEVVLTGSRP